MDMAHKKGLKTDASNNGLNSLMSPNPVMIRESDVNDESRTLLPPAEDYGNLSKDSDKLKRKVQWLDNSGDELAQILEFQPSVTSATQKTEIQILVSVE
ncbi:hypothetical protein OROGR_025446 [Orobanche gracilis]